MINKTMENPTDCGPPAPLARRILVVDDDEGLNRLAQHTLHRGGFETQGVLTGAEAIARVIADPGLTLLLDHKLPDMDGTELIRTLIEQGRRIPFVAMTGHGNEQIAVEMMKLGAKEYLPKAFNITEILPEVFHRVFRELETERRLALAEQALAEAEARYRGIFENAGEGIFQTGLDGTIMVVNPALARLYGYDSPEHFLAEVPKTASLYVDSRDRERWLAELLNNDRVDNFEVRLRHRDGRTVWSSSSARLIRDAQGRPLHISGSVQDITERKRFEAALTKSEAVLRKAQEIAHLGHWELDLVANRLLWSDETYRIFGLSPQEFGATYEAFLGFVHPDDRAAVDAAYSRSVRERLDGYEIEHRILRKNDDAVRHVQERCEHVRDSTGTVVQSVGTVLDITERKRAEQALAASEEKFRNVADYTYDWEYWLSPEGQLVWVSPSCELFTGYRVEEFMADPDLLRRVVHPEDRGLFDKHLHDIETGSIESCDMDFRIIHSSGQTVWLNHFCVDIARADGTPLGRRASNRDITERKQAEDKLTKELALSKATSGLSEALIAKASTFQDIADISLHYSKLLTGSDHGFVSVIDPKNGDLVSYTLTQMMGEHCRVEEGQARITFPANPDGSYSKLWGHALNLQTPFYTNSPASHPASSGTPAGHIPLKNFLAVPALIGDKLIGLIALANKRDEYTDRDLEVVQRLADLYAVAVDRQATVTALRAGEQQIRGLFNATTDSVMLLDQAATILAINEGGAKRRGLVPQDMVGRALEVFLAPDLAARRREGMEESARAKHWVDIEETHDDGRFYHVRLFPILDDAGNAVQFASFSRDVTEGVLAENSLRDALAYAQELAGKAEAANKAKSEFLANMSHEIRTPLNGILGMLQVLQCTPLHEDQKDFLINAIKSSTRLNRLLSDILDISVIEAGKIALRRAAFSITETCQSVQDLFAQEAAEKRLTLHFSIDDRLPSELIGDEGRLRQILFNLVGNALKFTSLGGVEMDICLVSPPGELPCRVLFSVTDTGIGIPDNMISDIFEPFTQVEGSFIRRYQGAGLGLAIVRRLTRLMGGEICIASEEGVGTSMYVVFSFGAQTQSRTGLVSTASAEPMPDGGKKLILLVEDDEINQLTMKCLLEMGGHAVTTAGNGKQALEWLRQDDFELIIMDVQMPVMDGIEATRIIRGSPEFKAKSGIPIIAVTAYAMIGDRENFLAAGMNDYIPKPVDQDALLEMIKRLTAHR